MTQLLTMTTTHKFPSQLVAGTDLPLLYVILHLQLFGVVDHSLEGLGRGAAFVAGDSNLALDGRLIRSRYPQYTIDIHVEADFKLQGTPGRRPNSRQVKIAQQMAILESLKHLDGEGRLVVRLGGDGLGGPAR